jgi:uncharacterized protein YegP (UPF0339 family)
MSPKFQVYKDASGKTRFRLRANNNKIVAVSEAYEKYASCIKGIESVKRNCNAQIEDLTIEGGPKLPNPKYQIFKDAADEFRFHLKAANGEIIAQSEGYESRDGCLNGINVVRDCANAEIEDPFAFKKAILEGPPEGKIEVSPAPQPLATRQEETLPEIKAENIPPAVPVLPIEKEPMLPPPAEKPEAVLPDLKIKAPEPTIKTEEIIPTGTTPTEEIEIIQEVGPVETTIELHSAPENIAKGDRVNFQGRLFKSSTGKGIPNARIHIYERDKSFLGDDYLAYGGTGQDGSFNIPWKARNLTWRKNAGNIYAKFNGNEKAKPSQSTIQEITIK